MDYLRLENTKRNLVFAGVRFFGDFLFWDFLAMHANVLARFSVFPNDSGDLDPGGEGGEVR